MFCSQHDEVINMNDDDTMNDPIQGSGTSNLTSQQFKLGISMSKLPCTIFDEVHRAFAVVKKAVNQ